jgi:toxin ParE1/3/4
MAKYTLTKRAAADIDTIANHSFKNWGNVRAESYISALKQTLQRLADFPGIGQDASELRTGYMRMPVASHVVFYHLTDAGVRIVRVLHQRVDVSRHLSS